MTARILLVENLPAFHALFRSVAGAEVEVVASLGELTRRLARPAREPGPEWDYAFVDFDYVSDDAGIVGGSQPTGLTALDLLATSSPGTRCIVFTSFHENGRQLYAAAAHRWFGAWGALDKGRATKELLDRLAADGTNPTTSQWATKLARRSHLVDALFAGRRWDFLWTRWNRYGSTDKRVLTGIEGEPDAPFFTISEVRTFSRAMMSAVPVFNEHFETLRDAHGADKPQSLLTAFYEANSLFLNACDLPRALAHRDRRA